MEQVSCNKCFGGEQKVFKHQSDELKCTMNVGVYVPPQAKDDGAKLPVLYYLSGLTCTQANFIEKSGFQRYAAEHGIVVVNPDTSPRGVNVPGEDDSYDFGSGAGFYVDATQEPWAKHYRMYSYVTKELPALIERSFPFVDPARKSITGHSMGGHGALICALKNPNMYKTVTAFSPICNPSNCPWGQKAFKGYLGDDKAEWRKWDATYVIEEYRGATLDILIDQGEDDQFYEQKQLLPEAFVDACTEELSVRMQKGYDHSYYFIATFIGDHFAHHAKYLNA